MLTELPLEASIDDNRGRDHCYYISTQSWLTSV